MTYTLRYDEQGYATAIERDGYTVLHLQAGTERNEEEASSIVNRLNRTVADEQINELLWGGVNVWAGDINQQFVRNWLASLNFDD